MAEKDTTTVNVLGKPTSRKQQQNRRTAILVIAGVILILVIIAAYRPVAHFVSWNSKKSSDQQAIITSTVFKDQFHNQSAQAVKYLKSLQHYYTLDGSTRYFIDLQLASLDLASNNTSGALTIYQGLIKSHPNDYQVILGLARSVDPTKNKSLAIQYYQKVINYLNTNQPAGYKADAAGYQNLMQAAEQGQ